MAAEASRSSSTSLSADSYIGSLISLISKSEIRYEGVLFNINTSEASIGLRNVRSFGTEGRKQDGPQLPSSDKVYEYILFRGSDIKDLQVKSSPPVQNTAPIYNDPAIIQSHFPHDAATSTSLPYTGTRSQQDPSSYTSQVGLPKSTAESSVPLYHPSGSFGSWGSWHPSSTPNDSRLPIPMYSQGFYGPSDGLQTQQQPLLQPPPGLWMPPSVQQTQYPAMSASLPSRVFGLPTSPLLNIPPPLMPSFSSGTLNSHLSLLPFQSSAVHSNSSTASVSNIAPIPAPHPAAMSTTSLPLVTPPTTVLDKSDFLTAGAVQPKTDNSVISYNSGLESEHSLSGTSESFPNKGLAPSLVTPNQFLQSGPTVVFSSQSSESVQDDIVVVQVSSTDLEQPLQTLPESKGPILPLTAPVDHKVHGDPSRSHNNNRGGRGRGRGHWASDNVTSFTDDFDFDAMNEKFNKDEVWGHLGKTNTTREDGYSQDEDDAGTSNFETKPVYVKDDFFDSLSSNSSGRSRNGRTKFFEQMKVDTRMFGNFGRHRFGRGSHVYSGQGFDGGGRGHDRGGRGYDRGGSEYSRGFGRSGQLRGAHYGRSYGYNERGGWGYQAT